MHWKLDKDHQKFFESEIVNNYNILEKKRYYHENNNLEEEKIRIMIPEKKDNWKGEH